MQEVLEETEQKLNNFSLSTHTDFHTYDVICYLVVTNSKMWLKCENKNMQIFFYLLFSSLTTSKIYQSSQCISKRAFFLL